MLRFSKVAQKVGLTCTVLLRFWYQAAEWWPPEVKREAELGCDGGGGRPDIEDQGGLQHLVGDEGAEEGEGAVGVSNEQRRGENEPIHLEPLLQLLLKDFL